MLRLTIPHRFDFGADRQVVGADLQRPEVWDSLRLQTTGDFALPADRAGLERVVEERPDIVARAARINAILDSAGADRVVSYGVGGATLEYAMYHLVRQRRITVTEYAPGTVARLAALAPELDPRRHDLLTDAPLEGDLHLFHRIDLEFRTRDWRRILSRFSAQRLLVVPVEPITWRTVIAEAQRALRPSRTARAGWLRTTAAQRALWSHAHRASEVAVGDRAGWLLEPR